MSRKSVERFCDNDMREQKHVAQKCAAVLRQRHAPDKTLSRKTAQRLAHAIAAPARFSFR
jgi:hypothetical protein